MKNQSKQISRNIRAASLNTQKQESKDFERFDAHTQNHEINLDQQSVVLPVLEKQMKSPQTIVKVINLMSGVTPVKPEKNLEMYKQQQKKRNFSQINRKTKVNLNISLADNQKLDIDLKIKQSNQNKFQLNLWLNNEDGAFAPSYQPNKLKQVEARSLTPIKLQFSQNPNQTPEPDNETEKSRHQYLEPLKMRDTQKNSREQSLSERIQTSNFALEDQQMTQKTEAKLERLIQTSQDININIDQFVQLEQRLSMILKSIRIHNHQELLTSINDYMELIIKGELEIIETLFKEERLKRLIRQAMMMERIGVLKNINKQIVVLVNSFFEGHFFLVNISNFKNILMYSYQNYFILCEILIDKMQKSRLDDEKIDRQIQILKHVLNSKEPKLINAKRIVKQDNWNNLKQNTEMLQNLFKQLTKNCRDLNQFLVNLIRICSHSDLKSSFRSLIEFTSLYFTVQQSYQGMLGVTLLTVAPEPYLPEIKNKIFTLVLDMDETLVHFSDNLQGGQFQIRPYAIQFLTEMQDFYELVVFTAGLPDYANWVLNSIDPTGMIIHRLFRHHAIHQRNVFIKDLSRMGRDLTKCIIVDNVAENFQNQPDNGIFIRAWYSDPNDTALAELAPLLKQIVLKQYDDVRLALNHFKDQMTQNIQQGVQAPHLNLLLQ